MPYSAQELQNISNAALSWYIRRPEVLKQSIQTKPLLRSLDAKSKTFASGKGDLSVAVKGDYSGVLTGFSGDDVVGYYNPANIKRASFPWKEMHIGLGITYTELKTDGITVSEDGHDTSEKDGREATVLANLLQDKMEDMSESYARGMDVFLHGDGSTDPKAIAGIRSLILDAPASGSTGGINRATSPWWRNRARTAAAGAATAGQGPIVSSGANGGTLIQFLQAERRQLMRFAQGTPNWQMFAGSDFIGAYENELRANGRYTDSGYGSSASVDGAMEGVRFGGKLIEYDPTMDDAGMSKRMYWLDMNNIRLYYMIGEKMKRHSPSRPVDRYIFYKGMTTTGVMVATQLSTSGVYDIS